MACSRRACLVFMAFLGAIMAILGGVLIPVGNDVIYTSIKEVRYDVTFFNVTFFPFFYESLNLT